MDLRSFRNHKSTRTFKKELLKGFLFLRGYVKSFVAPRRIENIFHAAIQRTGSQWIKAVFSDQRIIKHTRLLVYPQHRYEWNEFQERFPEFTFVPGLYISYPAFEEIVKPRSWKAFYVLRDPRDVVVSWYYSMLETHALMGKVPKHRKVLRQLSFEEGISYSIKVLNLKFQFMRTWVYNSSDPNVLLVRFEDLVTDPFEGFVTIFNFCQIDIPDQVLKTVLEDYTKEEMRRRDLQGRIGSKSHYRETSADWREIFTDKHKQLFYAITGNLIETLGYSRK